MAKVGYARVSSVGQSLDIQREKLSSMPHNIPQSWEGQAGMPGFGGGGGY